MVVCLFSAKHFFFGTTAPRTLKFGTNVGYGSLHCGKENSGDFKSSRTTTENWLAPASSSIYYSILLSL